MKPSKVKRSSKSKKSNDSSDALLKYLKGKNTTKIIIALVVAVVIVVGIISAVILISKPKKEKGPGPQEVDTVSTLIKVVKSSSFSTYEVVYNGVGAGKMIHLICVALKLKVCPVLLLDEPLNHLSFRNSQLFNKLINEIISKNPELAIIMVSHCRAVDFTQKVLIYDMPTKNIKTSEYLPYNCFVDDIGRELGCE